jgi:NAD(P)-dependent dehydrogenase (short-subunit alcohol dehydrogenase family)
MDSLANTFVHRIGVAHPRVRRDVYCRSPAFHSTALVSLVATTTFGRCHCRFAYGAAYLMFRAVAVVVGATGGIGGALSEELSRGGDFYQVIRLSRPSLDLCDEASIARVAAELPIGCVRLLINATGFLHDVTQQPEKSLRDLNPAFLAHSFALNAIGPALLMKHLFPLLPRQGRTVVANLSARVGSIGDNQLGGWYGYRSSKAALNQLVRTAAIELARTHPEAICVALHPGTVATSLSAPFVGSKRSPHTPIEAARHMLTVIENLKPENSGGFFDWRGESIPW